jgi:hypothetical protein
MKTDHFKDIVSLADLIHNSNYKSEFYTILLNIRKATEVDHLTACASDMDHLLNVMAKERE